MKRHLLRAMLRTGHVALEVLPGPHGTTAQGKGEHREHSIMSGQFSGENTKVQTIVSRQHMLQLVILLRGRDLLTLLPLLGETQLSTCVDKRLFFFFKKISIREHTDCRTTLGDSSFINHDQRQSWSNCEPGECVKHMIETDLRRSLTQTCPLKQARKISMLASFKESGSKSLLANIGPRDCAANEVECFPHCCNSDF